MSPSYRSKMQRCYMQFQEALRSLHDEVRAERAVILAWFSRVKSWGNYASALASARMMRDRRRSTAGLLKAALERMRPDVPVHRVIRGWTWEELMARVAEEALPTQQACTLSWALGARGTAACGVRPGDVRPHALGVQVKLRVDKGKRPRAAAWKLVRHEHAVRLLAPLAACQPPVGANWADLTPMLPPETIMRMYRIGFLRANRHEVSTVVAEAFGTEASSVLLNHSAQTSRGSYQERPAREAAVAAELLMRRDELMASVDGASEQTSDAASATSSESEGSACAT